MLTEVKITVGKLLVNCLEVEYRKKWGIFKMKKKIPS